jgi:thioesterase domain-containing protein
MLHYNLVNCRYDINWDMAMNERELEQYLYQHIPLSLAMQVSVNEVGNDCVVLSAPLAPNINHASTVFGGSASAVAILAAWSLVHVRLNNLGINCNIVIQRNSMEYEQPIYDSFTALSSISKPEAWDVFIRTLSRRGKARISVSTQLEYESKTVGRFEGEFVAVNRHANIKNYKIDN